MKWTRVVADYPESDGWALQYKIVGPSTLASQPAAAFADGLWTVTLGADATAGASFTAGTYRMVGYVEGSGNYAGERYTVFDGFVELLPNVAEVAFTDLKTHEEKMLAAIQAALEGRTTADIENYQIDGTNITKIPMERLLQLQGIYKAKIWRQKNPGQSMPVHALRFGRASGNTNPDEARSRPGYRA